MNDYDFIQNKIVDLVYPGNRHNGIRDISRMAGGYKAAGRIDAHDAGVLRAFALNLCKNENEFAREWDTGFAFGTKEPIADTFGGGDNEPNVALSWDSPLILAEKGARKLAAANWVQPATIDPPKKLNVETEFSRYLKLLFKPEDHVGFVVDAIQRDDKWSPASKGCYYMTAKEILADLKKGPIENVIGDYNREAGAWVRFNPLDGNGIKDANVTDYRFALVECDEQSIEEQVGMIHALNLPCACIVHSGGHSAHAIVHIDAGQDLAEYKKRVEFLYKTCRDHGLKADKTGNPSRLSRLPGCVRSGIPQYIIEGESGPKTWDAWIALLEEEADDLPQIVDAAGQLARIESGALQKKPEIIKGILREGHKMRISGPSKAGKSFSLLELGVALTEGVPWMGVFECPRRGKVLYVNLELDGASCMYRLKDIYKAMGITPKYAKNLLVWQLRGHVVSLDKLAPIIIKRCKEMKLMAIIVDPIYKVLTGDENNAADMAKFCNFFDRIAVECGCAIIDCHHHSKGAQGGKKAIDRSSGSGVFARDPDAILDMIELSSDIARAQIMRNEECEKLFALYAQHNSGKNDLALDAAPEVIIDEIARLGYGQEARDLRCDLREQWQGATGWRIEASLREFPAARNTHFWFRYPVHVCDRSGLLYDCKPEGEEAPWKRSGKSKGDKAEKASRDDASALVMNVVNEMFQEKKVKAISLSDVVENLRGISRGGKGSVSTVAHNLDSSRYSIQSGMIVRRGV